MSRYYTRACNFYYGLKSKTLVKKKKTLLLNGNSEISFDKIEIISNKKVKKNYQLDKPKGVRGRNSDNTLIRSLLNWDPKFNLHSGLEKTYEWIYSEMNKKHNQ